MTRKTIKQVACEVAQDLNFRRDDTLLLLTKIHQRSIAHILSGGTLVTVFGRFYLTRRKPRKYHDYRTCSVQDSGERCALKYVQPSRLRHKIRKLNPDICKE